MDNSTQPQQPHIFISYCWSPVSNKEWVMSLANKLTEDGVFVVIDAWDGKEGSDKYVFMERMVNDPTIDKVLLICNKEYAFKANSRKGGVGNEGIIISSEIYDRVNQTKFIPVLVERDDYGHEYLPTFISTRFYVDLCDGDFDGKGYEKLLRIIYDKPETQRPKIGSMPKFLIESNNPDSVYLSGRIDRIQRLIENNSPLASKEISRFSRYFFEKLGTFKKSPTIDSSNDFVREVEDDIEKMLPLRKNFLQYLDMIVGTPFLNDELLVEFFGDYLRWLSDNSITMAEGNDIASLRNDHFRHFTKMLFIETAVFLLKNNEFGILRSIINSKYVTPILPGSEMEIPFSFLEFRSFNRTLEEFKKQEEGLTVSSVEALVVKRTADNFDELVKADILLYYLSLIYPSKNLLSDFWFPTLGCYNTKSCIMPKLSSRRYFEKAKLLFDVNNAEEMRSMIAAIKEPNIRSYERGLIVPSIAVGLGIDNIATID